LAAKRQAFPAGYEVSRKDQGSGAWQDAI
jgi:hypothetical protein